MNNFAFLQPQWAALHGAATEAAEMANTDARTACFYALRTLELAVVWLYEHVKTKSTTYLPEVLNLRALIAATAFAAASK